MFIDDIWRLIIHALCRHKLIVVPKKVLDDVVAETKSSYDSLIGLCKLPCDTKFEWSIYLGQQKLTIDEQVGIFKFEGNCYLAFEEYESSDPEIVLGMAFIREYCQVYDLNGHIGFAKSLSQ